MFLFGTTIHAERLVLVEKAAILAEGRDDAKIVGYLPKGKKIVSEGGAENGFYFLRTKKGKKLYIRSTQVQVIDSAKDLSADLETKDNSEEKTEKDDYKRWHFDFGASIGADNSGTFFELGASASYFMNSWLFWKNGVFWRGVEASPDLLGLDTSIQATQRLKLGDAAALRISGGPGYRIATQSVYSPFLEFGMAVSLGSMQVGGGVKYIAHSWVGSDRENEFLFSLLLAGGAAF